MTYRGKEREQRESEQEAQKQQGELGERDVAQRAETGFRPTLIS